MGKKKSKKVTDGTLDRDPVVHALMEETNRYQAKATEAFDRYKGALKNLIEHLRAKETDPEIVAHFDEMLKQVDLMGVQIITFSQLYAGGSGSA